MAVNIDPVVINDGDPVSAEVIQRMNSNIAKVALGEKITAINITNTTGTSILKSANTTIHGQFNAVATPNSPLKKPITYENVTFTDIPSVTLQIENPNAAGVAQLHGVYLTESTKTGFSIILIASASAKKADGCVIRWIAVGNVDNNTQA